MRGFIKKIAAPFFKKVYALYLDKPRKYTHKNISVWVEPSVFPPFFTFSTKLLMNFLDTLLLKEKSFLELGCGCGIISILAAKKGAKVTATDINKMALKTLEKNAIENQVFLEILESDLFENLTARSFDVIIINPPYYPKSPETIAENAWYCGENFEYFKKLFAQLPPYLTSSNKTFMILSEDCLIEQIQSIAAQNKIYFNLVSEETTFFEKNYIFQLKYQSL